MTDYTLTIYCFVDDFLKVSRPKEDSRRKVSDAEIITTVVVACRFFHGNFVSARAHMEDHQGRQSDR